MKKNLLFIIEIPLQQYSTNYMFIKYHCRLLLKYCQVKGTPLKQT